MATEPLQAAPYPVGTDAPDGPAQVQALALWSRRQVVQVYASSAARTAAFTAASISPAEGMVSWLSDVNRLEQYNGTAWEPVVEGESWTALPTITGYTTIAGTIAPGYRKLGPNRVVLRGQFNIAASTGTGTKWTLPAAYRPAANAYIAVPYSNGTAISGHLRYDIGSSGNINQTLASPASTVSISFEGISYPLD